MKILKECITDLNGDVIVEDNLNESRGSDELEKAIINIEKAIKKVKSKEFENIMNKILDDIHEEIMFIQKGEYE